MPYVKKIRKEVDLPLKKNEIIVHYGTKYKIVDDKHLYANDYQNGKPKYNLLKTRKVFGVAKALSEITYIDYDKYKSNLALQNVVPITYDDLLDSDTSTSSEKLPIEPIKPDEENEEVDDEYFECVGGKDEIIRHLVKQIDCLEKLFALRNQKDESFTRMIDNCKDKIALLEKTNDFYRQVLKDNNLL